MASIWKLASQTFRSNRTSLFLPGSTPSVTQRRSMWVAHMPGKEFWCERLSVTPLFSGCTQKRNITLLTTFKVVDNSILGKSVKKNRKPYLIGFYKGRKTAEQGDVIKVAIAGKTNKAVVIGTRKTKHHTIPRYDNNCIVLVDDNLAPLGTRVKAPIPTILRKRQDKLSKVLALATRFI